jgi:tight adherence protein B
MRCRSITAVVVALVAVTALARPAGAAEGLGVSEARMPKFPQRVYVLTLPQAQALGQAELSVTENGEPVDDLKVSSLGAQSAVVLAIDASRSMRGKLDDAMAAARAFADRRLPDQRLGIIFFASKPTVALDPTTNAAAIERTLAQAPPDTLGTRVYDAAASGIATIERAGVAAGSVIVLSDGADHGSFITRNEVLEDADRANVRLFGVGVRSWRFDRTSLEALSAAGGDYAEAAVPGDLAGIYTRLAERQGREFLVRYRSRQPLESDVAVAFSVTGIGDVVTAAYRTPDFPVPPALPDPPPTWWESSTASTAVVLVMGLLLALGLWILLRPLRGSITSRISLFTGDRTTSADEETTERVRELLEAADGRLSRWRPWQEFELDVELARLRWSSRRIVLATLVAMIIVPALLVIAGAVVKAVISLLAIPVVVRLLIRYRATKTRRRFEDQLPDNLQVMASALRAGHSFIAALSVMVKDAPEPSRKEFNRVVQDEQLGISVEQSLEVVHDRMRCDDVIYVGLIATLQRDTGGSTAEVLDKVVETMRERGKLRRLVRTLTAQGRLGGWIVTALPVAMILFLSTFKPGYLAPMTEEVLGWVILVIAGLMVALGAYCIRRIVDIKV